MMMDEQSNGGRVLTSDPSAACLLVDRTNQHTAVTCDSLLPPIGGSSTSSSSQFAMNRTKTVEFVVNGFKRGVIADSGDVVTVPTTISPAAAPTAPQLQKQSYVRQPAMLQRAAVVTNASGDLKAQLRLQNTVYGSKSVVTALSSASYTVHHRAINPPAGYAQQQRPRPGVNNNNNTNNEFSQFAVSSQKITRRMNNCNTYSLSVSRPPPVYLAQPGNGFGTRFPTIGSNSINGVVLPSTANNPYGFIPALQSFAGQASTAVGNRLNSIMQMPVFRPVGTLFPTNPNANQFLGNVPFVSQNVRQRQPEHVSLSFGNVRLQLPQPVFQSLPQAGAKQISGCVQTVASNAAPPSYNVNIQLAQQQPQTLAVISAAFPAYNAAKVSIPTCPTVGAFTRKYTHLSSAANSYPVSQLLGSNCVSTVSATMTASSGSSKLSSSSFDGGRFPMFSVSERMTNATLPTQGNVPVVGNQLFNHLRWSGSSSADNNHTNKPVRVQKFQKSADTGKGGIIFAHPRLSVSDVAQPMQQCRQQSVVVVKRNSDFSQFCISIPKAAARPIGSNTTTTDTKVSNVQQVNATMSASQTANSVTSDFADSILASLVFNDASVPPVTNASYSCVSPTADQLGGTLVAQTDRSGVIGPVDNLDDAMSNLSPDVIDAAVSDFWSMNDFSRVSWLLGSNCMSKLPATMTTSSGSSTLSSSSCVGGRFPMFSVSERMTNVNLPVQGNNVSAVRHQLFNHLPRSGSSSADNISHTSKYVRAQKLQKSADIGKGGIMCAAPRPIVSDVVQPMQQCRQHSVNGVKNNSDFSHFRIGRLKAAARPIGPKTTTTSIKVSKVQQVNKSTSACQTTNSETPDCADSMLATLLFNDASVPPVSNASNSCLAPTADQLDGTIVAETDTICVLGPVSNADAAMINLLHDVIDADLFDFWTMNDFCNSLAPELPASATTCSGFDVPTLADCQIVDETPSRSVTYSSTEIHQTLQTAKSIGKGMHHVEAKKIRRRELQRLRRKRQKQQLISLECNDVSTNSSLHPNGSESRHGCKKPRTDDTDTSAALH